MKIFNKILIANRGEIAVRIIRTLNEMGILSVAICAEKDSSSLHCKLADEVYVLKGDTLGETYLSIDKIIEIAVESDADAIHPGYGFLSENPDFSVRTAEAGLNFIGPPGDVISLMGNKLEARKLVKSINVPLIEGLEGKANEIAEKAENLDYPVIVKAAAGGGGKAMRIVNSPSGIAEALEITRREAKNYFGDDNLYVEKYFNNGRHIEVQVIADHYGNIIIPGERECSIQRRYQKVIEETPSIFISEETRNALFETSRKIVREIGYVNAGTIEFLVDENQNFYFLEMNTRIQVEHPVTEETTGLDLVEQQIYIAAGNKLRISDDSFTPTGHSMQARLYAEDPQKNFLPSPGFIYHYSEPKLPGLRIDSGIKDSAEIFPDYDPLIAKVIATAATREESIQLLGKSLQQMKTAGVVTNREFLFNIIEDQEFISNEISTTWLEKSKDRILTRQKESKEKISKQVIFAVWLIKKLYSGQKNETGTWQRMGYWRQQIRKSVVFKEEQYDLIVSEKSRNSFRFLLEDDEYEVQIRSVNDEKIMFLLGGQWFCAGVVSGGQAEDLVYIEGREYNLKPLDFLPQEPFLRDPLETASTGRKTIRSPLHGRVVKLNLSIDQRVTGGQPLFTLDAMKIENRITSPYEGCIKEIRVIEGEQVKLNQVILVIDDCKEPKLKQV